MGHLLRVVWRASVTAIVGGALAVAAVPRAWAGVVILSADRETIVHSHLTYLDGFQPQGQPADQLSGTTTVAPDLAPFNTGTQTSNISTSSAPGFTLSANGAGSFRTQAPGSTVRLNETWTYNLTAITFQVTDRVET